MKQTLSELTSDMLIILEILDDDEIDFVKLTELDADIRDKMDGTLDYCEMLESYEQRCKAQIARLRNEVRLTENKRKRCEEHAAFEMNRLGTKTMQTNLRQVTCVEKPFSANYDTNDKALETIDERCIEEQVVRKVSKSRALEIYKQTGEIARGFDINLP